MSPIAQRFRWLSSPVLFVGVIAIAATVSAQIPPAPPTLDSAPAGQPNYAACQPPNPGEYLLLVVSKTPESQDQVRRLLPPSTTVSVCNYLNDVVTRVGGFTSADTANAWAKYIRESAGLAAVVARPSETAPPTAVAPQPSTLPSSQPATSAPVAPSTPAPIRNARGYNPQALGAGYAVLVDYFSQPELATRVHQLIGKDIGLAAYRQRPYLLAIYTSDQRLANSTLQSLTDRGFWAMVVDSRRVTLLRRVIDVSPATVRN